MTDSRTNPGLSLAVTSAGMVSSLGIDLVSSCAASRAGMFRTRPLDEYLVGVADSQDVERLQGCPASDFTKGYEGLGRLLRLGQLGLEDLLRRTPKDALREAGLAINVSSGYWITDGSDDPETGVEAGQERLDAERELLQAKLIPGLLPQIGSPPDPTRQQLLFEGPCGFLDTLQFAADGLSRGTFKCCIVGGIDSYISRGVLLNLATCGALKTPDTPSGLIPGEGAAFLTVELPGREQSLLTIDGVHWGREKSARRDDEPCSGESLARVLGQGVDTLTQRGSPVSCLLGSQNGDVPRAQDWGTALVRLRAAEKLPDVAELHPAASFGEVGAATGFFQVCMAMRAQARGYAAGSGILGWLSGHDGTRGAYGIRAGGPESRELAGRTDE